MDFNATARLVRQTGEDCLLRRFVGRQKIRFDVALKVRISHYMPQELVGNIVQGDQLGIMSNQEIETRKWPGPPKRGDLLIRVRDGSTLEVQSVEVIQIYGRTVRHNVQLRGP